MKKEIKEFIAVALTSILIVYIFTMFLDKQYQANIENNKLANSNEIMKEEKELKNEEETIIEEKTANTEEPENLGQKVVDYAVQFVGNPYVYGGNSLTNGTDCSGFVKLIFQNFGIDLPRSTNGQATSGTSVSLSNRQPGDIISYGYGGQATHSAIYIGDDKVVHAATPSIGITYGNLYMMNIIAIRRVI